MSAGGPARAVRAASSRIALTPYIYRRRRREGAEPNSLIPSVSEYRQRSRQEVPNPKNRGERKPQASINMEKCARPSRKEVFQPHLPVRLPCYDLAPITGFTLGRPSRSRTSGAPGFHGLTGGVYKARERIHRAMADARLLANPAS